MIRKNKSQDFKAINEKIFIKETGVVHSDIIEVVGDPNQRFKKGKVLSVGEEVTHIKVGDVVIFNETLPKIDLQDEDENTESVYIGCEESVYCKTA